MSKKTISIALLMLLFAGNLLFAQKTEAANYEYRSSKFFSAAGVNYLAVNNKNFVEILKISSDNKLSQVSELHGISKVEDFVISQENGRIFCIVSTGRYLVRYNLADPSKPKIEFQRDMYAWKRGQYKIGSITALAVNNGYIFGASENGVRSFQKENLFVDKIYSFDKSYGIAADESKLYVLGEKKVSVYDLKTAKLLSEMSLANQDKTIRKIGVGSSYFYFPSDNSIVKAASSVISKYTNPAKGNYSYAAAVSGNYIFYVNGHGVTKLDANMKKQKFVHTAAIGNGWGVGVENIFAGSRGLIAVANKTSVLLFDENLKLLSTYKYSPSYKTNISTDLKVVPSVYYGVSGTHVVLEYFGYWPNESIEAGFGYYKYRATADNQGHGKIDVVVPNRKAGRTYIEVTGKDSKLNYQVTFTIE